MGLIFDEPWAAPVYDELCTRAIADDAELFAAGPRVKISGCSWLTATAGGHELWRDLCGLVYNVTQRSWRHKADPGESYWQNNGEGFKLPEGDFEALAHELCHWLVASPGDRLTENLRLHLMDRAEGLAVEELVWAVECRLFAPVLSERDLAAEVSPRARTTWKPVTDGDPVDLMVRAADVLRSNRFPLGAFWRLVVRWEMLRGCHNAGESSI